MFQLQRIIYIFTEKFLQVVNEVTIDINTHKTCYKDKIYFVWINEISNFVIGNLIFVDEIVKTIFYQKKNSLSVKIKLVFFSKIKIQFSFNVISTKFGWKFINFKN